MIKHIILNQWSDYDIFFRTGVFFGDSFFLWRVKVYRKLEHFISLMMCNNNNYVHVLELHKSYQPAFCSKQNQSYDCINMLRRSEN